MSETQVDDLYALRAEVEQLRRQSDETRRSTHILSEQAHDHAALILAYQEAERALRDRVAVLEEALRKSVETCAREAAYWAIKGGSPELIASRIRALTPAQPSPPPDPTPQSVIDAMGFDPFASTPDGPPAPDPRDERIRRLEEALGKARAL